MNLNKMFPKKNIFNGNFRNDYKILILFNEHLKYNDAYNNIN